MKRSLLIPALAMLMAACAHATTPEGPKVGTLHVTQTISGPLYVEGSIGYVRITQGSAEEFEGRIANGGLDRALPLGTYTLSSYQRICSGNCDHPGPPTDRCAIQFTLGDNGQRIDAVVTLTPTKNSCSISAS
jgi:hypothetical protein